MPPQANCRRAQAPTSNLSNSLLHVPPLSTYPLPKCYQHLLSSVDRQSPTTNSKTLPLLNELFGRCLSLIFVPISSCSTQYFRVPCQRKNGRSVCWIACALLHPSDFRLLLTSPSPRVAFPHLHPCLVFLNSATSVGYSPRGCSILPQAFIPQTACLSARSRRSRCSCIIFLSSIFSSTLVAALLYLA